jgi:hypothetical protein
MATWFEDFVGGCDANASAGTSGYCAACAASTNCSRYYPGLAKGIYWLRDRGADYQWAYDSGTGYFHAVSTSSTELGYYLCAR